MTRWYRLLADQFARPSGWLGRWLIGPWLDRIARAMNDLTLEVLAPQPSDRVLEIGFGGGGLLKKLIPAAAHVTGVDVSQTMVERARRRFAGAIRDGRLALHEGQAEALPLEDDSVDEACSVSSVYFWKDAAAAMAELARVIRPGGRLVLCFEPPEELRKWPGHEYGFRLWRGDEIAQLMRDAGFGGIQAAWGQGRKPDLFLCLSGTLGGAKSRS